MRTLIESKKLDNIVGEWFVGVNGVIRQWKEESRTPRLRLARKKSLSLEQYQELSEYEIRDSFRIEAFRIESLW